MSAEIIHFAANRLVTTPSAESKIPRRNFAPDDSLPQGMSRPQYNKWCREKRSVEWDKVSASVDFHKAHLEFITELVFAQRHGLPECSGHPKVTLDDRWPLIERRDEAIGKKLLTPAPDKAAVIWKRAVLERGDYKNAGVTKEQVERAIAADIAFLDAHPYRSGGSRQKTTRPD